MKSAIDTNILVRLIVRDEEAQFKRIIKWINNDKNLPVFIACCTLLELTFVLKSVYKFPKTSIIKAVEDILSIPHFKVEHEAAIRLALPKCSKGLTFFDSVIGEIAALKGLKTYTFDKSLIKKNSSFEAV